MFQGLDAALSAGVLNYCASNAVRALANGAGRHPALDAAARDAAGPFQSLPACGRWRMQNCWMRRKRCFRLPRGLRNPDGAGYHEIAVLKKMHTDVLANEGARS